MSETALKEATQGEDVHAVFAKRQPEILEKVKECFARIKEEPVWIMLHVDCPRLGGLARSYIGYFVFLDSEEYEQDIARSLWITWPGRNFDEEDESIMKAMSEHRKKEDHYV